MLVCDLKDKQQKTNYYVGVMTAASTFNKIQNSIRLSEPLRPLLN